MFSRLKQFGGWACLRFLPATAAAIFLAQTAASQSADPIRIGDLSSYGSYPAFTEPYRNGWRLAFEEINAAGGILGKGVEIVSRDDAGTAAGAIQAARDLVEKDKVSLLFGTFLSGAALAVADFASQNKIVFIATLPLSDDLTLSRGNRYTFRPLRAGTYMQTAMLVDAARSIDAKRWAIIAPNYELGLSAVETFKSLMGELDSDAEVVAEHYGPLGHLDAATAVDSLVVAKPDAIFSALFGADLAAFTREANRRGLLGGPAMLNLIAGEPEWLAALGADVPAGAIVTGYAPEAVADPKHQAFVKAYKAKFAVTPGFGSLVGYAAGYLIKDLIEKAGSLDQDKMVETAENLSTDTIIGPLTMRGSDHQGTIGTFVGTLAVENGGGKLVNPKYVDGAEFLPPEELVEKLRP